MDFILELLSELIFEGAVEISKNRKVPKYIRYSLIILIILLCFMVIMGLIALGIFIASKNLMEGIMLSSIGVLLLILSVFKFKNIHKKAK
ncbi:hypothetical protein ABHA01_16895 [Clostridium paraputrificum]|uniref:hypothetical protein n=1 Tax=Clostridium TaxID=1485 RepID=UPI0029064FAF|nr:hypothetical protein [Clostridium sp.]MDU4937740.1 hypothetical protein [Clostridium sp.]